MLLNNLVKSNSKWALQQMLHHELADRFKTIITVSLAVEVFTPLFFKVNKEAFPSTSTGFSKDFYCCYAMLKDVKCFLVNPFGFQISMSVLLMYRNQLSVVHDFDFP